MDDNPDFFMANAAAVLRGWADFAAAGGLDGPPEGVPRELLDMDGRVANEVPTLVGVALAIHAAGKANIACTLLSFSARTATNSPDAIAKIVPLAIGLAIWAGAGLSGVLRGLGCVAALAMLSGGMSEPPEGSTIAGMVANGATWGMSLPGSSGEATLEALGFGLASACPHGFRTDGSPRPGLFAGWAAYLEGDGLDRPIDSVPFPLLGGDGASDEGTGIVISAAMRLAAGGSGREATRLLGAAEGAARLLACLGGRLDAAGIPAAIAAVGGAVKEAEEAAACYAALRLWHAGAIRCLDPGHTLRKMAARLATRFSAAGATYAVGELSGGRGAAALRGLSGGAGGGGEDAGP